MPEAARAEMESNPICYSQQSHSIGVYLSLSNRAPALNKTLGNIQTDDLTLLLVSRKNMNEL